MSLDFMFEPTFQEAWNIAARNGRDVTGEHIPDIRWRAHVALWAARHALTLDGDFVDCGVFTGILASVVCHCLRFETLPRRYWLFDTWEGIPTTGLVGQELELARHHNDTAYHKVSGAFEKVKAGFSAYPNCTLVQGVLPGSLTSVPIEKIAYLSVDLNNAAAEKGCIDALWPKIARGAIVLLDDYGWRQHTSQRQMWDRFAQDRGTSIATLPTGQGILIRP